jgi:hypothetical protein
LPLSQPPLPRRRSWLCRLLFPPTTANPSPRRRPRAPLTRCPFNLLSVGVGACGGVVGSEVCVGRLHRPPPARYRHGCWSSWAPPLWCPLAGLNRLLAVLLPVGSRGPFSTPATTTSSILLHHWRRGPCSRHGCGWVGSLCGATPSCSTHHDVLFFLLCRRKLPLPPSRWPALRGLASRCLTPARSLGGGLLRAASLALQDIVCICPLLPLPWSLTAFSITLALVSLAAIGCVMWAWRSFAKALPSLC